MPRNHVNQPVFNVYKEHLDTDERNACTGPWMADCKALGCFVERIGYYPKPRTGALWAIGYPDMLGCVEFFKNIDPDVQRILTYVKLSDDAAEFKADTEYRIVERAWRAFPAD